MANFEETVEQEIEFDDVEDMALEKLIKVMAKMPNDSENNARDAQIVNDLE